MQPRGIIIKGKTPLQIVVPVPDFDGGTASTGPDPVIDHHIKTFGLNQFTIWSQVSGIPRTKIEGVFPDMDDLSAIIEEIHIGLIVWIDHIIAIKGFGRIV